MPSYWAFFQIWGCYNAAADSIPPVHVLNLCITCPQQGMALTHMDSPLQGQSCLLPRMAATQWSQIICLPCELLCGNGEYFLSCMYTLLPYHLLARNTSCQGYLVFRHSEQGSWRHWPGLEQSWSTWHYIQFRGTAELPDCIGLGHRSKPVSPSGRGIAGGSKAWATSSL